MVDTGDGTVSFLDQGGTGQPLIFLHGLAGSAKEWIQTISTPPPNGFVSFGYSLPKQTEDHGQDPRIDRERTAEAPEHTRGRALAANRAHRRIRPLPVRLRQCRLDQQGSFTTVLIPAWRPRKQLRLRYLPSQRQ